MLNLVSKHCLHANTNDGDDVLHVKRPKNENKTKKKIFTKIYQIQIQSQNAYANWQDNFCSFLYLDVLCSGCIGAISMIQHVEDAECVEIFPYD